MARPKTTSKKVPITLPEGALALLDQLVTRKVFGETRSEVGRHLLISALDELSTRKRLDESGPKTEQ